MKNQLEGYFGSDVLLEQFAFKKIIWAIEGYHPPKARSVMSYLNVAEFVDDHIFKAGKWHFDQVEGERNPFGYIRIATPTSFHCSDGDGL